MRFYGCTVVMIQCVRRCILRTSRSWGPSCKRKGTVRCSGQVVRSQPGQEVNDAVIRHSLQSATARLHHSWVQSTWTSHASSCACASTSALRLSYRLRSALMTSTYRDG
uniref:Uncharacterized protein n=1 Tax=Rhipicephalus microplus TaxID=6941 RepID=A0A6G5AHE5_RHIMP